MTTLVFVYPCIFICIVGIIAHSRRPSYWSAVRYATIVTIAGALIYFSWLHFVFTEGSFLNRIERVRAVLIISFFAGVVGFLLSMLIGLPFVADRRIAASRRDDDHA